MNLAEFQILLGWCALINIGLLMFWLAAFFLAHDALYGLHRRWFHLSQERFDAIHYAAMGFYKLSIILLFASPYLALRLIY